MNFSTEQPKLNQQTTIKYAAGFRRRLQLAAKNSKRRETDFARLAVEAAVEEWERQNPELVRKARELWELEEAKEAKCAA